MLTSSPVSGQVGLRYDENYSLTYDEVIEAYRELDEAYPTAELLGYGKTDVGRPLHLFVISASGEFDPAGIRAEGKSILFILNGIHPGESCGIDASVEFARDILEGKGDLPDYLDNTVLCIVPVYSIGGALNRSAFHRANMDPAVEAGFRGNARNLDLNRDFIKLDTRNARSFVSMYREWDPDVFLDNHVTNGSDHQYTVTLINSVTERLDTGIGDFLNRVMLPGLYDMMKKTPYEMTPYVHYLFRSPEQGIAQPMDPPRFSAGYTALFNTISFLNETHVYKPFADQVRGTWHLMKVLLEFTSKHSDEIRELRMQAVASTTGLKEYSFEWELDSTRVDKLFFKGYAYKERISKLTGEPLRYYDLDEPWEKEIPYYRTYKPGLTVEVPRFFIISQAWEEVVERLELNGIRMEALPADTTLMVKAFYIDEIRYASRPSNGHFIHGGIRLREEEQAIRFYRGDLLIPSDQEGLRYLMETLDPRGEDSFMRWNFFDPVLDRREYVDPSRFEERAAELLAGDEELRNDFEAWKKDNPESAASGFYQLWFIYTHSEWAEKTHRRYPVYRLD